MLKMLINLLVLVMLAGIGLLIVSRVEGLGHLNPFEIDLEYATNTSVGDAADAVRRLQREITLQSALGSEAQGDLGYPKTLRPEWFAGNPPRNPLLTQNHPWVEIASPAERNLTHPPNPFASSSDMATFWYNPYNGIVRARVPVRDTDGAGLRLYDRVNATTYSGIYASVEAETEATAAVGSETP